MKKDTIIIISIILLGALMYALTLRGSIGNPTVDQFKNQLDQPTQAFELSPERGRYVHVVALAEHGSFELTKEWAEVAYPDVGISTDGRYYSFFAPGVAYMTLPFYVIGSYFGLAQVATFSAESFVSIITLVFIFLIGRRIFALPRWASFFAVLVYAFGSTSWSYAVTLYQNAFTACFMVTSFYAAWRFSKNDTKYSWIYAAYVWLAYALAITVDYPNALLMLPVMIYLASLTISLEKKEEGLKISVRWAGVFASIAFVILTGLHLFHNAHYYGDWKKLAGGLKSYVLPEATTTSEFLLETATSTLPELAQKETEKTISGFFHEELMPHGFYILLFSDERGLFFFTPVFIFSLIGIYYVLRRKEKRELSVYLVPLSFVGLNIFLYSSWGDPWGGWAYGARYLIPSMTWLALFIGVALYEGRKYFSLKILIFISFLYSSLIALLGALTTNAVPPKSEGLLLPAKTYNFMHNIQFMERGWNGSFVYKTYLSGDIPLLGYFAIIYGIIVLLTVIVLLASYEKNNE